MVHSTRSVLVTLGLWAASSCAAALADGTVTPPRGECHRPFPAFLWAGSQAGEQQQVMRKGVERVRCVVQLCS